MTPAYALISRLETLSIGVGGETIFLGSQADLPNTAEGLLTIIETGGFRPLGSHNDGSVSLRRPSFQVSARAIEYDIAVALLRQAYAAYTFTNLLVADVFFLLVAPTSDILSLPNDAVGRSRLAFNIDTVHR
jgi:hypothetical protein